MKNIYKTLLITIGILLIGQMSQSQETFYTNFKNDLKSQQWRHNDCGFSIWHDDIGFYFRPQDSCGYDITDSGDIQIRGVKLLWDFSNRLKNHDQTLGRIRFNADNMMSMNLQVHVYGQGWDSLRTYTESLPMVDLIFFNDQFIDSITIYSPNATIFTMDLEFIAAKVFRPRNNSVFCQGEEIQFDYRGSNWKSLRWIIDNNIRLYNNWKSYTFTTPGMHNVKCIIEYWSGMTDTIVQFIEINNITAKPKFNAFAKGGSDWQVHACRNDNINFSYNTDNNKLYPNVEWNFGDGSPVLVTNNRDVFHAYSDTGHYKVVLTVRNLCNNAVKDTIEAVIVNTHTPPIGFNVQMEGCCGTWCPGTPLRFYAWSPGNYTWEFGDGGTSTESEPLVYYSDTGNYDVILTYRNGCGYIARDTQPVHIRYDYMQQPNDPWFNFEIEGMEMDYGRDTIHICPGTFVSLRRSDGYYQNNTKYEWDFGDGSPLLIANEAVHVFTNATEIYYPVTLRAFNGCGGQKTKTKWVHVNPYLPMESDLRFGPNILCPGEKVYFWDQGSNSDNPLNKYSVYFGDGQSVTNFTGRMDTTLGVNVTHTYSTIDTFNFTFIAYNPGLCLTTDTLRGTIITTNDTTVKPFYYVHNSTLASDGGGMEMIDWSKRMDPTDHEYTLNIKWPQWQTGWYDTLLIAGWYGGINFGPNEEPGDPQGWIKVPITNQINDSIPVKFYVPINSFMPPSIGIMAAFFCTPDFKNSGEPLDVGFPFDTAIIMNLPVISGASSTVNVMMGLGAAIGIDVFDGNCPVAIDENKWKIKTAGNENIFLELTGDEQYRYGYELDGASTHDDNYDKRIETGMGRFEIWADTIAFYGDTTCMPMDTIQYRIHFNGDSLFFTLLPGPNDCPKRAQFLTGHPAFRQDPSWRGDYNEDHPGSGCVSTPVAFQAAGGVTYRWNFGDGSPTLPGQTVTHAYTATGTYNASVAIVTNCGRHDTVFTKVVIDTIAKKKACIETDMGDHVQRGEEVQFETCGGDHWTENLGVSYHWDFGDGATSNIRTPKHAYQAYGTYKIKLTVTNGCGQTFAERMIWVENFLNRCDTLIEAKFSYIMDTANNILTFNDRSFGSPSVYYWDFSDGDVSTIANPVHQFDRPGIYNVCFSIFDQLTGCTDMICEEIKVGFINCQANFDMTINNTLNKVIITNTSENAAKYFWDFDDGSYDTTANPVHVFAEPGYYEICLSIRDSQKKCVSERCKMEPVGQLDSTICNADFNFTVDGDTLKLYENIQGMVDGGYYDLGDGNYAYEANPTHVYSNTGIYKVCMVVYNSVTGCQSEMCKDIVIGGANCKANFSFTIIPATNDVLFNNTSTGAVSDLYWDLGDGRWADSANPNNHYADGGVYNVCLYTYDSATKCQSQICKEIRISDTSGTVLAAKFTQMIDPAIRKVTFSNKSTGGATSWYWTFGDGKSEATQNPVHIYSNPGLYKVCLVVFNGSTGASSQLCKDIAVGVSSCSVKANFSFFINNNDNSISLNDRSTGVVNSWFWNFGDGSTSILRNPRKQYSAPGFYLITLAARDTINKCNDYFAAFVQIGSADCKSDFIYTVSGLNATLTNKSTGSLPITNYFWMIGDGTSYLTENATHTFAREGMYNVGLTASNALCMDYFEKEVQIGDVSCNADFDVYVDSASNTAYFTNRSLGTGVQYYWVFGDGTVSRAINPTHKFLFPGYYTVSLNTFKAGCMDFASKKVLVANIGADVEADFIYTVDDVTKTVSFTNKSIGNSLTYSWHFGDTSSTDKNKYVGTDTSHTYERGGYYNVCLRAKVTPGVMEDMTCKMVRVAPPSDENCLADIAFSVDSATRNVTFYDQSYGVPVNRVWRFGDNTTANDSAKITHTYTANNYYTVRLDITTATGCHSVDFALVNVNGGDGLKGGFGYIPKPTKASGYPVDFVGISHGDAAKLRWSFGDGTFDSTSATPTHVYATPGTYVVCIFVSDPLTGDTNTTCQNVVVGSSSVVEIKGSITSRLLNYPNPANDVTYISYTITHTTPVNISIYKADGTLINTFVNTTKDAGEYKLIVPVKNLSSGLYYIRLTTDEGAVTNKMVIE